MFFKNQKINTRAYHANSRLTRLNWGFTLMELMVVMFVSTVILTTLVVQNNRWNDQLTVNTQAYEVALMIRQAQIYSLGVREDKDGSGNKFDVGYGVFLDMATPDRYTFFADRNKDLKMDLNEAIEAKNFSRGVTMKKICGFNPGGQEKCSSDSNNNGNLYKMSVSFRRPDPQAILLPLNNGGNYYNGVNPPIKIYLQSIGGKESFMTIDTSGQISISQ
jgi:competence protein ComGC